MAKFCQEKLARQLYPVAKNSVTHQARLNKLCVHIVVLGRVLNLENNLDKRAWEVLDEDDLGERGLQNRLEVPLSGSYIDKSQVRNRPKCGVARGLPPPTPAAGRTMTSTCASYACSSLRWASMGPFTEASTE